MEYGDKYSFEELHHIVKNKFKKEYEYVLLNFEVGG
jgi:hypothetical protein